MQEMGLGRDRRAVLTFFLKKGSDTVDLIQQAQHEDD
jgi:hypothetical protein